MPVPAAVPAAAPTAAVHRPATTARPLTRPTTTTRRRPLPRLGDVLAGDGTVGQVRLRSGTRSASVQVFHETRSVRTSWWMRSNELANLRVT